MKFLLILMTLVCPLAKASVPVWFSEGVETYPGCSRELLCALGSGETLNEAMNEARSEISRFFQAKINSKSHSSSSYEQKGSSLSNAKSEEWANKSISVESSEIISGLEIKKQTSDGGKIYLLMALDRQKAAGLLKDKIMELDNINDELMRNGSRFVYPRVLKNLRQISPLLDRYGLLSDKKLELKIKSDAVLAKLNQLSSMKVALVSVGKKIPVKISHALTDLLSSLKIVIVSSKNAPTHLLRGEIVTEERYLKVDGFKKINVVYKLELLNRKSEVLGKMSTMSEQVARSSEQALDLAFPEIKDALEENLDQLSSK